MTHWWEESLPNELARVAELKEACDGCERRAIEQNRLNNTAADAIDAAVKAIKERDATIRNLELALAQYSDDLSTYKDYYGTSVAQVRHLGACEECRDPHLLDEKYDTVFCPDYPTE